MFKKLVATILSASMLVAGWTALASKKIARAEDKGYTYLSAYIFNVDFKEKGDTYVTFAEDANSYVETTATGDWNVAYLPGEGKIVLKDLTINNSKFKCNNGDGVIDFFGKDKNGQPAPLAIEVIGKNSISIGMTSFSKNAVFHGRSLDFFGTDSENDSFFRIISDA